MVLLPSVPKVVPLAQANLGLSAATPLALAALLCIASSVFTQQVILPTPRLLTTMPMGAEVGTTVEVGITGENLEDLTELQFSMPKLTAKPKLSADGKPEANKFVVTVAADAPVGVHDARVVSRLGGSSARAFTVSTLAEVTRATPNTSLETALELKPNSVCNAVMTAPGGLMVIHGTQDGLFTNEGVREAFDKIGKVYAKAGVPDRFEGVTYDGPHEFNAAMQDRAFAWLDRWLKA